MTELTTDQTVERQEKWEPIDEIKTPAASALISEDHEGLTVTLSFSKIAGGSDSDLLVSFGQVLAYTVYEELVHPWETLEGAPRLADQWVDYFYPLLKISDSRWIASLPNLAFTHPDAIHYRLLTLDKIVDVLCREPPQVRWASGIDKR
jgi:hypothetical protein